MVGTAAESALNAGWNTAENRRSSARSALAHRREPVDPALARWEALLETIS